ncbi:o-succinylbenzoate--CoA ligase [Polycladomyces subterraneus]|uniref:O-succinylbenzoate--CoA ligase n=1 Tax=Polycladomyces subterraneus TaxID=1016997 RepID=A0ABT8IJU7_9BACL|nr:o-succinylbenzoate--CoA ligase [Polycladomyces subterraneus]MDN4593064.1 o-succinylbenzoate--CoA ligase [Polycladomyces subterraneus]
MKVNLGDILTQRSRISPKLEALVGEGYRYTFQEFNIRVNQFASFLLRRGLSAGDRLGILCRNHHQHVTAFFAAAKIGVVTVPLNWRLPASGLDFVLQDVRVSALVYDAEFGDTVHQLGYRHAISLIIRVGGSGEGIEFESAIQDQSYQEPPVVIGGDAPAVIMYTSGTTGKPKGAILSHNNFFAASVGTVRILDWRYRDRFLSVTPLFHIGGLNPVVVNVHTGTTTYFMPEFHPSRVWEVIQEEHITHMMSVPVMIQAMLQVPEIERVDLPALRFILCGASPVSKELIHAYRERNIQVGQVYGTTEFTGGITFWTHEMGLDRAHSAGKALFHGKIKIVDPSSGQELPPGEIGEIVCSGPQTFQGYWNRPKEAEASLNNGWFHTGDLGKMDEEGFLYVVDRLKDMIISGGENVYPAEVEAVIRSLPGVDQVAVVGVPDPQWGEVPKAYVVPKPGIDIDEKEIIEQCKSQLAKFQCPRLVEFIHQLPQNAVGKVLKSELRKRERVER